MSRFVSLLIVFTAFGAICVPAPSLAAELVLRPPSDAPILDPFRLPDGPYGAGNRGIEYDTPAGAPVSAAAPGVVIFAGPVAGNLHITVDHGGGLRSSYSFVDQILVARGDRVDAGARIATTGGPLHFGTRLHGRYVDPADLFGSPVLTVALVPHDDPESFGRFLDLAERSERLRLLELWQGYSGVGLWGNITAAVKIVAGFPYGPWAMLDPQARLTELVHLAETLATLAAEVDRRALLADLTVGLWVALHPPPCTPGGVRVASPPERRIAVVVDGLDSSSADAGAMAQLDLSAHGYEAGDVVRFSYSGGIVPPAGDGWAASIPASHYRPGATRGDVEAAILELVATLEQVAGANPGVIIDVFGHSLGGLLVRHSIAEIDLSEVPVDTAVTFSAPHQGAASAELIEVIELTTPGQFVGGMLETTWPDHILVAPVGEDVSKTGFAGDTAGVGFPPEVHAVTIGARADVIVPATDAWAPGANHVVVGGSNPVGAHGDIVGWAETNREVELALAGLPPACEGAVGRMLDVVVPRSIEYSEHVASGMVAAVDAVS